MDKVYLDPEYSIQLGTCYFIDNSEINEDWLCIVLAFAQVFSLIANGNKLPESLIEIKEYPIAGLLKLRVTDNPPNDPIEVRLSSIKFCLRENIIFLTNLHESDRELFISETGEFIPEAIPLLKKSFLTLDILRRVILPQLPSIQGKFSDELLESIIEFKKTEFWVSLTKGIENIALEYEGNYYLTAQLEAEIQTKLINNQSEFLRLINFDRIKSFDFKAILEDGASTLSSAFIPFLPLGTIIELYNFCKNSISLRSNEEILFAFSLMYLQKILVKKIEQIESQPQCPVCKITSVEIEKISDRAVHNVVLKQTSNMCLSHMIGYLESRKFSQLTGKALLKSLKEYTN